MGANHTSMWSCLRLRPFPRVRLFVPFLCFAVSAATPVSAAAANAYPFDNASDYLAPATAFDNWANALQRHRSQQTELYRCPEERRACRGRLRSFSKLMTRAQSMTADEQLELVHFYVNRTRYDDDHPQRVYDEQSRHTEVIRNHWSTLYEFLIAGGDCEDFATAKYFMLRELGFAADAMRVVVVYERRLRGYHAVLAVRRDDGRVWLFDSDNFIRRNGHRGYRYVYAMNEEAVWDHREDFQPTALPRQQQTEDTRQQIGIRK